MASSYHEDIDTKDEHLDLPDLESSMIPIMQLFTINLESMPLLVACKSLDELTLQWEWQWNGLSKLDEVGVSAGYDMLRLQAACSLYKNYYVNKASIEFDVIARPYDTMDQVPSNVVNITSWDEAVTTTISSYIYPNPLTEIITAAGSTNNVEKKWFNMWQQLS